jgi:hypothetical protein
VQMYACSAGCIWRWLLAKLFFSRLPWPWGGSHRIHVGALAQCKTVAAVQRAAGLFSDMLSCLAAQLTRCSVVQLSCGSCSVYSVAQPFAQTHGGRQLHVRLSPSVSSTTSNDHDAIQCKHFLTRLSIVYTCHQV